MAEAVFDLWYYGQSAYVPSVAQMRLLYAARDVVGPIIGTVRRRPAADSRRRGVLVLDLHGGGGAGTAKAWLYSMSSGAMQETPKIQAHRVRPIITINH